MVRGWNALPEAALALLRKNEAGCLFQGEAWLRCYSHDVAEPNGETPVWLMTLAHEGHGALLPLCERRRGSLKTLAGLANYYTPYYGPILAGEAGQETLRGLFAGAVQYLRTFDALEMHPMTRESVDIVQAAAQELGFAAFSKVHTYNWRQCGIRDFQSYWAERPSRLVNTARRARRRLDRMGNYRLTIAQATDLEQAIEDYCTVYARSWKSSESHPGFIRSMLRQYSARDQLRLGLLYCGEKPVAAQIWLLNHGTAYIYKLAYDPDYHRLSVGTVLTQHLFEHVVGRDGVHTVDFLTGDDAYKADWMSERRPLYHLTLANPGRLAGRLLILRHRLSRGLMQLRREQPA